MAQIILNCVDDELRTAQVSENDIHCILAYINTNKCAGYHFLNGCIIADEIYE